MDIVPFEQRIDQIHRNQIYITNFSENSVSVIDISDPLAPVEVGIVAGDSARER